MLVYVALCIYLLILYLMDTSSIKSKNYGFIAIVPFFILSAFRDSSIGNDTRSYLMIFERVKFGQIDLKNTNFEIGYIKLNECIAFLFSNSQSIIIITSIMIYTAYYFFIKKFSASPVFSIFLFLTLGYFGNSVNLIRQQLALSIVFLAWNYLRKDKVVVAFILILFASLFHNTALVFLLAIVLKKIKINKISIAIFSIITIVGYIAYIPILNLFLRIFPVYNNYIGSIYMNGEVRLASIMNLLVLSLIFIFGLVFKPSLDSNQFSYKEWNMMTVYIMISISLTVLSLNFNLIARATDYFSIFSILYIPGIISNLKDKKLKLIIGFLVVVVCLVYFFVIQLYRPEWNVIYPYKFYR